MKLRWLQLNRPCILQIPQVQDYGGQPLLFKRGLERRCVTEAVFQHPTVQSYLSQLIIVEVSASGTVAVPAAPTPPVKVTESAPVEETLSVAAKPVVAAPVVEPTPEPIPAPVEEPAAVTEPVSLPVTIEEAADSSASVSVEDTSSKETEDKGFEVKRRRRN